MRKTLQELRYRVDATMLTTILTQQFLTTEDAGDNVETGRAAKF
jgi:hypothetical protein